MKFLNQNDVPLFTPQEVAKRLGISVKTLMEHVKFGRIRSIIVGCGQTRKTRRFTLKNLETFIEKQKIREIPSSSCPLIKPVTSNSNIVAFTSLKKPEYKK